MRAIAILALLAAVCASPAPAQPADPRIQTVTYEADQVYRVEVAPGYQVMIDFAADEHIANVALGDSTAWQVAANRAGNQLVVKAVQAGIATNMAVTTADRTYSFELAPAATPNLYRLRFEYPPPPPGTASIPIGLTYGYKLSGTRSLWPQSIGDDGERTFIEWAKDVSLPAVYAIDGQGREALVNGMMRNDRLVVDATASEFVFRIDDKVARARRPAREAK